MKTNHVSIAFGLSQRTRGNLCSFILLFIFLFAGGCASMNNLETELYQWEEVSEEIGVCRYKNSAVYAFLSDGRLIVVNKRYVKYAKWEQQSDGTILCTHTLRNGSTWNQIVRVEDDRLHLDFGDYSDYAKRL